MRDFISGVTRGLCLGIMVTLILGATRSNDEIIAEHRNAPSLSMFGEILD